MSSKINNIVWHFLNISEELNISEMGGVVGYEHYGDLESLEDVI